MNTLNRYITRDFLITFAFTLSVLTFVMSIAGLVKAIDLLSRGVSGVFLLKMFLSNIPYMLMFSIPMSTLSSTLLMVGRLSLGGEITAMKACGLNLWQIAAPLIVVSILLSGACLYVSAKVAPEQSYAERVSLREVKAETPISLIEEGTWIRNFPGLVMYFGGKKGMILEDVVVFQTQEGAPASSVRAKWGEIRRGSGEELYIDLHDARIYRPDPDNPHDQSRGTSVVTDIYTEKLDLAQSGRNQPPRKRLSDMTLPELLGHLGEIRQKETMVDRESYLTLRASVLVEISQRFALSLSCVAFVLLAIPLGLKSRRKETSVGIGISLLIMFFFYFFIILAESLVDRPDLRPELIVWIPVFFTQILGILLIHRNR